MRCYFHDYPESCLFQLIFRKFRPKTQLKLPKLKITIPTQFRQLLLLILKLLLSFDFLCVAIFMITLSLVFFGQLFVKSTQNFESRLSKTLLIITLTYLRELLLPSLRLSLRLVPIIVLLLLLELDIVLLSKSDLKIYYI